MIGLVMHWILALKIGLYDLPRGIHVFRVHILLDFIKSFGLQLIFFRPYSNILESSLFSGAKFTQTHFNKTDSLVNSFALENFGCLKYIKPGAHYWKLYLLPDILKSTNFGHILKP